VLALTIAACDSVTTDAAPELDIANTVNKAQQEHKLDICHLSRKDGGTYRSIHIARKAEAAHRGHGDGQVGDAVPGMDGMLFDQNCVPTTAVTEITYAIAGVFDRSSEALLPVGTPYTATLTFDPSTLVASPAPLGGVRYRPASFSFSAGIVVLSGPVTIDIDSARDWIRIDSDVGGLQGTFPAGMRMNLTGSGLTSDDFPDPFPTLSDFTLVRQLVINNSNGTHTASVTLFEPAP
jgi:hypothetical protein